MVREQTVGSACYRTGCIRATGGSQPGSRWHRDCDDLSRRSREHDYQGGV